MDKNIPLRREIFIEAPIEIVFAYFTDAQKLAMWLGRQATLEPFVGGKLRIEINDTRIMLGEFIELVPYQRIVFTWGWEGHSLVPPGSTSVEVKLEPEGAGTRLQITHFGLPNEQEHLNHARAWEPAIKRLESCLTGS